MINSRKYTIGQISHLCNIPVRTLRFYDKEGIVQPERRDNNYRYYSENQLLQILVIKELKFLGFSLGNIKSFLKHQDLKLFQRKMEEKLEEIDTNIQVLKKQLQAAKDIYYDRLRNGLNVLNAYDNFQNKHRIYDIKVDEILECDVVYSRYHSPVSASELFLTRHAELQKIAEQHQICTYGPLIAIFHDHYTTQFIAQNSNMDLEVCFQIVQGKKGSPVVKKFDGFLGATTIHVGGYVEMFSGNWDLDKGSPPYGTAMVPG